MAETKFRIRGGKELGGSIRVAGSKNAILPCIAAAMLTEEPILLKRVPDISDVSVMVEIARGLGAEIDWQPDRRELTIVAKQIKSPIVDDTLSRKLRGSVLFSGALLSRMREAAFPYPGGDAIGARPLTVHLQALRSLGVAVKDNGHILLDGAGLAGGRVVMEDPSVTATENTILAGVMAPGATEICLAACEPHVQQLVVMLQQMGAEIRWDGVAALKINGATGLGGTTFTISPDDIEISSMAVLAAATRSEIAIEGVDFSYLDAVLLQLRNMGIEYQTADETLKIIKPKKPYSSSRIQCGLYPKLGSDHLPAFAVLATQAAGTSLIHEWMYEGRLGYIEELQKMGADASILDQHRAIIVGPTPLRGTEIASVDIRAGMAVVIAALVAEGETLVSGVRHIDRGYENLDERLRSLGAVIERVEA